MPDKNTYPLIIDGHEVRPKSDGRHNGLAL
jgi:hypothetical protein